MKRLFLTFTALFLTICFYAKAQNFEIPKYAFNEKKDYIKYEPDILKTIDWLEQTPWSEQEDKRAKAKAFYQNWLDGRPDIPVEINAEISKLSKDNIELMGAYEYGFTKYAILNKAKFDVTKAKIAGLKEVIAKYNSQPDHNPNPEVDKLIGLVAAGKLESWVLSDFDSRN